MTVIRPNSVSGINSITAQANEIKIFKSDGTQGGLMIDGANLNATSGISTVAALTVTGNVSIGGTLTYQDVTNIDSVGIITAQAGVHVTGGNVAVGHNNPSVNLHVKGSASNGQIYLGGTGAHSQIYADNDGVLILNADQGNSAANSYLGFNVDNSERLRIRSDGRVTIGAQVINTNSMLSIHRGSSDESQIRFTNTTTGEGGNNGLLVGIDSNEHGRIFNQENTPLRFGTNNTERVRIESGGFVGLGTNNPYHELHIQGSSDTRVLITSGGAGDAVMMFENASGNTWGHGIDLTNNNYVIAYNSTSDPSLTADGKVEITTAGDLLVGTDTNGGGNRLYVVDSFTDSFINPSDSVLRVENADTSGTTTQASISLTSKTSGAAADSAIVSQAEDASGNASLQFWTDTANGMSEKLRIASSGFMGLGTNAPAIPLDVHGADTNANGTGDVKGQLRIFNDTTAFGSSPRAGIVFSTKYRTSPDVPLDGAAIYGGKLNGSNANKDFFLAFATRSESPNEAVERMRIEKTGPISSNPASGDGDDFAGTALKNDWNAWADIFYEGWIGGNNGWGTFWAGSTGAAYRRVSSDGNPNEYVFIGAGSKRFTFDLDVGGNAYFDGSLSQNNYDYAEYFEWEDGNPNNEDRRGYSVFLNANGKIEKATSETSTSDIIGVISGTAAIIGDAAVYDWQGRYEIDEWGTRRKEQVTQVSWKDADGTKHSYADENDVPSDVVVPDDASRRIHHRYIESSTYDSSQAYVPRDERREWGIVGLLGKVRVRNDSPKHPNWKYIKTIAGKDLWLIK